MSWSVDITSFLESLSSRLVDVPGNPKSWRVCPSGLHLQAKGVMRPASQELCCRQSFQTGCYFFKLCCQVPIYLVNISFCNCNYVFKFVLDNKLTKCLFSGRKYVLLYLTIQLVPIGSDDLKKFTDYGFREVFSQM